MVARAISRDAALVIRSHQCPRVLLGAAAGQQGDLACLLLGRYHVTGPVLATRATFSAEVPRSMARSVPRHTGHTSKSRSR